MAQLDPLFKALIERGASELVLCDGRQPAFRFGDDLRSVSPRVLNATQIGRLLSELSGALDAASIAAGQAASFVYPFDEGKQPIRCELDNTPGRYAARLFPERLPTGAAAPEPTSTASGPTEPMAPPVAPTPAAKAPSVATLPARPTAADDSAHAMVGPSDALEIERYLRLMVEKGASDLHITSGEAPLIRESGEMVRLENEPELSGERAREMLLTIMPERNRAEYLETHDTDFGYEIRGVSRYRANVFTDRNGTGAVFRTIPMEILTAEQLGLSQAILDLCMLTKGLVLVTGPTGSGKSTTLAAMVDHINRTRSDHIITIEDPIEFVHPNRKCLVNQREIITHTRGFKPALRAALREDPDIVMVGEMRDLETIAIAIETAETGHLVFGTLHTSTACSTVDRIIDQFPADRQAQIRTMLSESLKGVVSQTLLKRVAGGRVAALEVLLVTPAIANLIREGKTFQIPSLMQTGRKLGMVLLNDALLDLVNKKTVSPDEAYRNAIDKAGFARAVATSGFKLSVDVES